MGKGVEISLPDDGSYFTFEPPAGEEKMIGEVWGLFEGFEELADDFVLELVALDFQLG